MFVTTYLLMFMFVVQISSEFSRLLFTPLALEQTPFCHLSVLPDTQYYLVDRGNKGREDCLTLHMITSGNESGVF